MNLKTKSAGRAILPLLVTLIIGLAGGVLISNYTILGQSIASKAGSSKKTEKEILYWVAPMDATFRSDKPGKSPMGMDLVPVYEEDGTGSTLKIDPVVVQNMGVRTALVRRSHISRDIRTVVSWE